MVTWIKEGTVGDLRPRMRKAHGKIEGLYSSRGADMYVSRRREFSSKSLAGSLHYDGYAEDITDRAKIVSKKEIVKELGPDFQVVEYLWGYHIEFDPMVRE